MKFIRAFNIIAIVAQRKIKLILIFVCLFTAVSLYSQSDAVLNARLSGSLQEFSKNKEVEMIYLQTSKGIYETGEDLWFKGYALNSQNLTPSLASKTMFVQLIEERTNKAVWEERYEIENGFVSGHVYVKDTLPEGRYTLAGYTSHSFYNDEHPIESFRSLEIVKKITAYHQAKKQDTLKKAENKEIDFQLFPEGGYLVSGIASKLAFKAVDGQGNPKQVSGTLYENGKKLLELNSLYAGMGYLMFTPDKDKEYHIELDSLVTTKRYELPTIKDTGEVLQLIRNTNEYLTFKVSKCDKEEVIRYVRIQLKGVVYGVASLVLKEEQYLKIPIKNIPQGIAEVTLFNQDFQPTAERLVYINQDQKITIKAVLDKEEYKTKSQVKLKLKLTDQNNAPVVAHLGLSVFDAFYNNPMNTQTIESHYHLSTQLKGRIYNPGYYFNPDNKIRHHALDLLLLTQGWRAYNWSETNLKEATFKSTPYLQDTLTGKLVPVQKKYKELLSQMYLMGFTADETKDKAFIAVDTTGGFSVLPEYRRQAARGYLYLKVLDNDFPKKATIALVDSSFVMINRLRKQKIFNYPISPTIKAEEKRNSGLFITPDGINKLSEVVIKTKKSRVFRDKYMGKLDSLAKLSLNGGDYVCVKQQGILNCPCHTEDQSKKPVEGKKYRLIEMLGSDLSKGVDCIFKPIKELVYKYPVWTDEELLRRFGVASIKGYYGKKEFYSPVYDEVSLSDPLPDYRNTLFWKPDIITDTNGEASVDFYCSDVNTRFLGVIEGVSGEGLLGRETFQFNVKKRE